MNHLNKITKPILSLFILSSLAACSDSSNREQSGSHIATPEDVQGTGWETLITLERVKDIESSVGEEGATEQIESFSRRYTLSQEDGKVEINFKIGKELYGNKNTKLGETEYVINDLCTDENCSKVVSIFSRITPDSTEQVTSLYKLEGDQYLLLCKEGNTKFEQQEDALSYMDSNCQIAETN